MLETEASGLRATARCKGAAPWSDTAEHRPHDRLLVRLLAGVLAHDPSCPHRDDPMREAHELCDKHRDIATASLLEVWIDETERRAWFLFASIARPDSGGR